MLTTVKKDNETILNWLTPEDKAHCLKVFENYTELLAFLDGLNATIKDQILINKGKYSNGNNHFSEEIEEISGASAICTATKEKLSYSFVDSIESYFINRYTIDFIPFGNTEYIKSAQPFNSIAPIFDNIFKQCGTDLLQAGKKNIIARFQQCFYFPEEQPQLCSDKIIFPTLFRWVRSKGKVTFSGSEHSVKYLLSALALFLLDKNTQPPEFVNLYNEWYREIDVKKTYCLFPAVNIKFFLNGKICVGFANAGDASRFWNLFELDGVAERNRNLRP